MFARGNLTHWASKEVVSMEATRGAEGSCCGTGLRRKVLPNADHLSGIMGKPDTPVLPKALPEAPHIPSVIGKVTAQTAALFAPPIIIICAMQLV